MFSSTSFAEWTEISRNTEQTNYVDYERIRKVEGYVYWWNMVNYVKRNKDGFLSGTGYAQGDCKLFRYKHLKLFSYYQPMATGVVKKYDSSIPNWGWEYPLPNSAGEHILKSVCEYAN